MKTLNLLFAVLIAALANLVRPFGIVGRAWCAWLIEYAWKQAQPSGVAHAIFDTNLYFRSTSDSLTQTETSAALTINGTPADGLAIVIEVPKKSVGDTMQVTLQHSTDNVTYTNLLTIETVASVTQASTVPFKIVRRFHTRLKYVRTVTTVAGTTPDFGVAISRLGDDEQWNVLGVGQNAGSTP